MPLTRMLHFSGFPTSALGKFCVFLVVASMAACSGGGGEGSASPTTVATPQTNPPVSNNPPSATITSPAAGTMITTLTVAVSGTASDDDGVSSVQVNGVEATSNDQFASWQVEVPLDQGNNTLTVRATDTGGNVNPRAAARAIARGYLFDRASKVITDVGRQRALLLEENSDSIMMIDAANRQRSEFSGASAGQGPPFQQPSALLMDTAKDRALVFDAGRDALMEVQLDNGDRRIISGVENGSGPALQNLALWALDPAGTFAYALSRDTLFKVQLDNGNRETTPLFGAILSSPHTLRVDARNDRILVSDAQTIYEINISNGQLDSILD